MNTLSRIFSLFAFVAVSIACETHMISLLNNCSQGTPSLMSQGQIVSTGDTYTSHSPFKGIAYLDTGVCGHNGENCTVVGIDLINSTPSCPNCTSTATLNLTSPYAFSVPTGFKFSGCNDVGYDCSVANCTSTALGGDEIQYGCNEDNLDLLITFCN